MSRLTDFLRRRKVDPRHPTRRALARYVEAHGFDIGDYSYGAPAIRIWGSARLVIGKYCSIADQTEIVLGGDHRTEWVSQYPFKAMAQAWPEARDLSGAPEVSRGDVVIGNDVWIGFGATILSGATIGDGVVVGARAVVAGDVPPYGIVVGNPARLVRRRFSEETIADLLAIQWWDFPRERIVALLPLLQGGDIDAFIAACRATRTGELGH